MPRSTRVSVLPVLLAFAASPAIASWGPDDVLTVGAGGSIPLQWGAIVPAGGGDLYAIWHFPSSASAASGVTRVTTAGALVFSSQQDWRTMPQSISLDGSGGVIEAFPVQVSGINNYDIAFRRTTSGGVTEPPPIGNYWAAQTPAFDNFPSTASDPAGGAYIAWSNGSGRHFLQRVTAAGTVAAGWGPRGRRMVPADGFSWPSANPALLPDGSGGVYMMGSEDVVRVWRVLSDTTLAAGWPDLGIPLSAVMGANGMDLALVAGSAGHTFAAWSEKDPLSGNHRIAAVSFDPSGNLDGSVLEVAPFGSDVGTLMAQSDGQGGVLLSWQQSGTRMIARVLANGTLGAGPIAFAPTTAHGAVASGANGGFIVFFDDASGIWGEWFLGNGTLDPSEPVNPRLVRAIGESVVYPLAALTDGNGGAYLLFDNGSSFSQVNALAQMIHVFSTAALDAGPRPHVTALALAVSPNPARAELTLSLGLPGEAPASVDLLDVAGRLRMTRTLTAGGAQREERLAIPAELSPGVYLVRLRQGPHAVVRRIAIVQ